MFILNLPRCCLIQLVLSARRYLQRHLIGKCWSRKIHTWTHLCARLVHVRSYTKFIHHKHISNCHHFVANNTLLFVRDAIANIFCQCSLYIFIRIFANIFHHQHFVLYGSSQSLYPISRLSFNDINTFGSNFIFVKSDDLYKMLMSCLQCMSWHHLMTSLNDIT